MATTLAPAAPPFCPNPACPHHRVATHWRYQRDGYFTRQAAPHRIQRYRCCHCRRRFSEQTFRCTYWLKRPELLEPIFRGGVACACLRQLARSLHASPQTILLHMNRLGRHCQLFHERLRPRGPIREPLALDGFVHFEFSQYHPTSDHHLVGRHSHFFYGFTVTEHRRSGRMTAAQRRQRAALEARWGRPDPRGTERDVAALLRIACRAPQVLDLASDEHADYPRAIARLTDLEVHHQTISSRAARTTANILFAVNLLDLLKRHSTAGCKRETIAFPKRRQMGIWRGWMFLVWRNTNKWVSERQHRDTPAMRLGLLDRRLDVPDLLRERLFITRIGLPAPWAQQYWGDVTTRQMPNGRAHRLRYAF